MLFEENSCILLKEMLKRENNNIYSNYLVKLEAEIYSKLNYRE